MKRVRVESGIFDEVYGKAVVQIGPVSVAEKSKNKEEIFLFSPVSPIHPKKHLRITKRQNNIMCYLQLMPTPNRRICLQRILRGQIGRIPLRKTADGAAEEVLIVGDVVWLHDCG